MKRSTRKEYVDDICFITFSNQQLLHEKLICGKA